jgi:acyl carrier protein
LNVFLPGGDKYRAQAGLIATGLALLVLVNQRKQGLVEMSIKATVISEIEQIAEQHKKTLAPLTDDAILLNTGLDSLCFAVLVARLEDRLGVDPFSMSDDISFPVTLGDFVRVYENATR